jgi:hypothetical protein
MEIFAPTVSSALSRNFSNSPLTTREALRAAQLPSETLKDRSNFAGNLEILNTPLGN